MNADFWFLFVIGITLSNNQILLLGSVDTVLGNSTRSLSNLLRGMLSVEVNAIVRQGYWYSAFVTAMFSR